MAPHLLTRTNTRDNHDIEKALQCITSQNPSSWSQYLLCMEYAYNSLPVTSTSLSPFQCVYGYQLRLFPAMEKEVTVPLAACPDLLLPLVMEEGLGSSPPHHPGISKVQQLFLLPSFSALCGSESLAFLMLVRGDWFVGLSSRLTSN